jgi:small GTP-binding protein
MKNVSDSILPAHVSGWRALLAEAGKQVQAALGDKKRIVILGPANTGKSTLYNRLIQSRADRQEVSPLPGTTRDVRTGDSGLFAVVDTPGLDVAGEEGAVQRTQALLAAQEADCVVLLLDGSRPVAAKERRVLDELLRQSKSVVVVLNKLDLLGKRRQAVIEDAALALGIAESDLVALSARHGIGIDNLLVAVVSTQPGLVAALGQALPEYRWKLAQTVIGRAATAAAAISLTPLPVITFVPLVAVQSLMAISIARVYGKKLTVARARELIFTFGVGMLGRTLFIELSKLGGPPGWVVAVAVAAGVTVAMGYAVATWFEKGEKLPSTSLLRVSRAIAGNLIARLSGRDRKSMRRRVSEALQDLPAEELEALAAHEMEPSAPSTLGPDGSQTEQQPVELLDPRREDNRLT